MSTLQRVARQHLQTCRLLGVDVVPLRSRSEPKPRIEVKPMPAAKPAAPAPGRPAPGRSAPDTPARAQPVADQAGALADLLRRHDEECPHCSTVTTHTQTVFGEGDPGADLLFVGEAPGEQEDRTGRPFVGRAGQKLDEIIAAMGLERADVYIANILKSRPPDNRTPLQHEVDACAPFLAEQIQIIRPRVIVALGGPSSKFMLRTTVGITRLRGQWGSYDDAVAGISIPVMPTFHPAYLLRNYTADTRKKVWSDMQAVMERLGAS